MRIARLDGERVFRFDAFERLACAGLVFVADIPCVAEEENGRPVFIRLNAEPFASDDVMEHLRVRFL